MIGAVPGLPSVPRAYLRVSFATSMANLEKATARMKQALTF